MRTHAYFDSHWGDGLPKTDDIGPCLVDPSRRSQFFARGQDGGSFFIEGLYGTELLTPQTGLVKSALYMHMNPQHGVKLQHCLWDGRIKEMTAYHSKGNLTRLNKFVRSLHGTPQSLGLFIPFEQGWAAIKEFIETNGELPKSIEWVADCDLPPGTFPDP